MIGKKSKGGGKANSEVLLVAGILEAHGYEIRSVKQGGKGGALVVKVFPPILPIRKSRAGDVV